VICCRTMTIWQRYIFPVLAGAFILMMIYVVAESWLALFHPAEPSDVTAAELGDDGIPPNAR
jgi:hypothetical protein